jgi:hypothetical protein
MHMKKFTWIPVAAAALLALTLISFTRDENRPRAMRTIPKGCVFRTVMGEESADSAFRFKTPEKVLLATNRGLQWLASAQQANGGWGAGNHYRQDVMDPHAVPADPATTSMVAMALLRTGSTFTSGPFSGNLTKALLYIVEQVEETVSIEHTITAQTGTQIQTKLGANIDVILAAQFLTNSLDYLTQQPSLQGRVRKALDLCVKKIQRSQEHDGSFSGGTWAGVLQSSLANSALESAQAAGIKVDDEALQRSREYQKGNMDTRTGEVKTDRGAGIVLYSVTGSSRATAKEARKVKEEMERAVRDGRLPEQAAPTADNLRKIGFTEEEALSYSTAYEVYQSAKTTAQREDVLEGFGNNGGEEFLSYLQTGESLIIGKDSDWRRWYDNTAGRLISIQNNDGSWNGHHCITSPVFCTATCLLILSVNQEVDRLMKISNK